jgi:hypothetical protein
MAQPSILYCHCQYAQVLPKELKTEVLRRLCESGVAFDAVPDLCEMAARRDPALSALAANGPVKIAACFPRAVKGLFHQCGADLALDRAEILNMRTQTADEIVTALLSPDLRPNVPVKGAPGAADSATPGNVPSSAALEPAVDAPIHAPMAEVAPIAAATPATL